MVKEKKTRKTKTPEEYWKKYEGDDEFSGLNSEINIDVNIIFKGMNGIIYETKEKGINCNPRDLEQFMDNLKKVIQMLDETVGDRISGVGEERNLFK